MFSKNPEIFLLISNKIFVGRHEYSNSQKKNLIFTKIYCRNQHIWIMRIYQCLMINRILCWSKLQLQSLSCTPHISILWLIWHTYSWTKDKWLFSMIMILLPDLAFPPAFSEFIIEWIAYRVYNNMTSLPYK